jgi:hypothetical protein
VATHNAGAQRGETVGAKLGEVGYWLVLLIGLIAALNALQLGAVVQPLNEMQAQFLGFADNIVGAGLIFFIGYLLATLARRVVETALTAANVDGLLQRAGLSRITGASGLARAVGTLVFVLIIIPVAISALQTLQIAAISDPAVAVLSTVLAAIPRLIAASLVLAIAFIIGRWASGVIEQLLASLGFDSSIRGLTSSLQGRATPALGAPEAAGPASSAPAPSKVVASIAMLAIMIFAAVEAAALLNFEAMSVFLGQVLTLGGRVLFGGAIIAVGVIIANVVSSFLDRSTGGAEGFASVIVKWATIALSVAMGLSFMDIADEIIWIAFGLILGSAAIAAALAFGIGGREQAARWLERWDAKARQQRSAPPTPAATVPPPQPGYTPPGSIPPLGE